MRSLEEALGTFCIVFAKWIDNHLLLCFWTISMLVVLGVIRTTSENKWEIPLAFFALLMTVLLVLFH